jgi:hypothetical protein
LTQNCFRSETAAERRGAVVQSARRWETKENQCHEARPGQLTHTFEHAQAAGNDCDSSRSRRRLPRTDARGKPNDHFQHSETDASLPGGSTGRGVGERERAGL